ncbi:Uncharacterised protein [Klebsiella pneumoniae]|uniref:Uncharacterized protein n=1 Tax=Klebsiella pneumoniae TaxID=573 RepID=A0A377W5H6_KLEPN|nr:Uncharacterised protein [Klebsiella pneumoniae]
MSIDISVIWFVIIVFATLDVYRDGWFRFRYWDAVQRGA